MSLMDHLLDSRARRQREPGPPPNGVTPDGDARWTVQTGQRDALRLLLLVFLGIAAAYLVARMLWPLLPAISFSAVLAALVYPLYAPFQRAVGSKPVAASLGTLAVFFLLVLPAAALTVMVGHEIGAAIAAVRGGAAGVFHSEGVLAQRFQRVASYVGLDPAGAWAAVGEQLQRLAGVLANRTLGFLSGLAGWLLQAGAALFTLYYLLRDGDIAAARIERLIPLAPAESARLVARAREVMFATVYGNVAVALVQGTLGGLAFAAVGLPGAALWGAAMALLSLLPVVGPPFVWVPGGVLLLLSGQVARGVVLLAFGALVISTIDNLLRALLVGGRAQLHPLVVFFSVIGGIFVFGAAGVLVGPVVFVVALAILDIVRAAMEPAPVVLDVAGTAEPAHEPVPPGG